MDYRTPQIIKGGDNMKLLKIEEVAEILQVSKECLYQWVHKRTIGFIKLNGKLRFSEQEISDWIQENKISAGDSTSEKQADDLFSKMKK